MTRQARQHLAKTDNSTAEQARQEQVHSSGPEGSIRRRWPWARRRAHHDLRCLCRGTAEAPWWGEKRSRRRGGGKRGQEHGEGACLVRGLPEHVLSPTIWPSVRSHVSLFDSASLFSRRARRGAGASWTTPYRCSTTRRCLPGRVRWRPCLAAHRQDRAPLICRASPHPRDGISDAPWGPMWRLRGGRR